MLHGRDEEIRRVASTLERARSGHSAVLVLRGEPGIGKTALLEHAAVDAGGWRVLRASGIEAEAALPGGVLSVLLRPLRNEITELLPPGPARLLLGAATDGPPDRFGLGAATLALLGELAERKPLLCLLDDVQWFDRLSLEALLFATRRLTAEAVAVLAAVRSQAPAHPPTPLDDAGMPELTVRPLDDSAAEQLLALRRGSAAPARRALLAQARGNPLALLELSVDGTAGATPSPTYRRLVGRYVAEIAALASPARTLLQVIALDGSGDPTVAARAAEHLGGTITDLHPAEEAGLLTITEDAVALRHPLVGTALQETVSTAQRLAAHRALAGVFAERGSRCMQAWHAAHAATAPDEWTAGALEQAAGRGGSAVVMLERAAELSPQRVDRHRRLITAAAAAVDGGALDQALTLADRAAEEVDTPGDLVPIALLRARVLAEQDRPAESMRLLCDLVPLVRRDDPVAAATLLLHAAFAASDAGDAAALDRIGEQARQLDRPDAARVRRLAAALHATSTSGAGGHELGDLAVELADGRDDPTVRLHIGWLHLMRAALEDAARDAVRVERVARSDGAPGLLVAALPLLARTHEMLGRYDDAEEAAAEGLRLAADTGSDRHTTYLETVLAATAAIRGDEDAVQHWIARAQRRGRAPGTMHAAGALSVLDLGLGRYEQALSRLEGATGATDRKGLTASFPDLVEAAVRAGRPGRGVVAAREYTAWAEHTGQDWTRAIALRCQALLAVDEEAETLWTRAVELHRAGGPPFSRARTELLFGEWLRRARRRGEARLRLLTAAEIFERLRATPWIERVRSELRAAGHIVGTAPAAPDPSGLLTAQELQVTRWATRGLSNREIGAQLFLSPRTVGYHLSNAYHKLGIRSRSELAAALPREEAR